MFTQLCPFNYARMYNCHDLNQDSETVKFFTHNLAHRPAHTWA